MSEQEDRLHKAQIEKWRRKKYNSEDAHDSAVKGMKSFLKSALKDQGTHKNVARDLVDHMKGIKKGNIPGSGSGYNILKDTDPSSVISPEGIETVTGYGERPWEDDGDYDEN